MSQMEVAALNAERATAELQLLRAKQGANKKVEDLEAIELKVSGIADVQPMLS